MAQEVEVIPEARRGRSAQTVEVVGAEAEVALDPDPRGQEAESRGQDQDQAPGHAPDQDQDLAAEVQLGASQAVGVGVAADSRGAGVDQEARAGPDQAPGLRQDPDPNQNLGLRLLRGLIDLHKKYDKKHVNIPLFIITLYIN